MMESFCAPRSGITLASGSPRRRELLTMLGIGYRVRKADVEEIPEPGESGLDFACRAAADKARTVAHLHPDEPVLGSDTVVEIEGEILGKPASPSDAAAMLRRLSGAQHEVHTAVALVAGGRCEVLVDTTQVHFRSLDDELISWYVTSEEPMDKAGAYAIQGIGGLFVDSIHGSPHTVVGLPIHRLPELFSRFGLDLLQLSRHSRD